MNDSGIPVLVGLAVGISFVLLIAMTLRPDNTLSDEELIAKYSKLGEISYFLEKYPDARGAVERLPREDALLISFSAEKQVAPPSEFDAGINVLSVSAYVDKPNHLALSVDCGASHGITAGVGLAHIGVGIADFSTIDAWENICFQPSADGSTIFEPDNSVDELNEQVYQFAFKPQG